MAQDLWIGRVMRLECRLLIRRSFDELAVLELRAGADQCDEVGCVDRFGNLAP